MGLAAASPSRHRGVEWDRVGPGTEAPWWGPGKMSWGLVGAATDSEAGGVCLRVSVC